MYGKVPLRAKWGWIFIYIDIRRRDGSGWGNAKKCGVRNCGGGWGLINMTE